MNKHPTIFSIAKIALIIAVLGILSIGWESEQSGSSGNKSSSGSCRFPTEHTFAIKTDGTLWAWGTNDYGQLGLGYTTSSYSDPRGIPSPTQVGTDTNWVRIVPNGANAFALKTDGTLWAWGNNYYGQLGDGTNIDKNVPTQITGTNWSVLSAGYRHTVALKQDGTLWIWGDNTYGQLGDGTTISKTLPSKIGIDTNWASIVCSGDNTFALKTDGTLWAWGYNAEGQLGLGYTTPSYPNPDGILSPTQVGTDTNWANIVVGGCTFALKTDGTLWAWGYNTWGQLGDGTNINKNVPTQISGTNWSAITTGSGYTIALKTDGTLWAWGYNTYGQLGDGSTTDKLIPTQIIGTNWSAITTGYDYTIVLKTDGTLWGWGRDFSGQLGDGTSGYYNSVITKSRWVGCRYREGKKRETFIDNYKCIPIQIGTDNNWKQVACGDSSTLAIKTDGTLWAWGDNYSGQLGDGTDIQRLIPTKIGTDTNWSKISTR